MLAREGQHVDTTFPVDVAVSCLNKSKYYEFDLQSTFSNAIIMELLGTVGAVRSGHPFQGQRFSAESLSLARRRLEESSDLFFGTVNNSQQLLEFGPHISLDWLQNTKDIPNFCYFTKGRPDAQALTMSEFKPRLHDRAFGQNATTSAT